MPSSHTSKSMNDLLLASESNNQATALEIVAHITSVITREWDTNAVMHALVHEAARLPGITSVSLWLTGAAPHERIFAYSHEAGRSDELEMASLDFDISDIINRVALVPDLLVVAQDNSSSSTDPLAAYVHVRQLAVMLLVPLIAHGRILGVLGLGGSDAHAFDAGAPHHIAHLLGDLFALAAESTRLQEGVRETNAQLVAASIEAQQRAEELSDEKEEREAFISLVAHELKNPLAALKLQLTMLQRRRASEEQQAEVLRMMANNSNRLQRLIDDLLDASRIAAGHFSIDLEPVDVVAIAREVTEEQQATTQRHRLQFVSERSEIICSLDRQRLAQVFSNLVSNAIKYSPEGRDIIVRVTLADGWVRVCVEDEGAGLSADDLSRLFAPYTRILRVREAQGTGLGLFITKGIVEAHGGTIMATSAGLGHGSTFTVALPYANEQESRE